MLSMSYWREVDELIKQVAETEALDISEYLAQQAAAGHEATPAQPAEKTGLDAELARLRAVAN